MAKNTITDILDVAAGNRSLSVAFEPASVAMVGVAVFLGMLAALAVAHLAFGR
jgi:hypothetical protein